MTAWSSFVRRARGGLQALSSRVGWGRSPAVTDPGPPAAEASQQVVHLSEQLNHKEDVVARKEEENTQLRAQNADLQQKCRTVRVPCPCRGEEGAGTAP